MQLSQLSDEYRATADRLEARLSELRTALETAVGENAFSMQRRIETLYAELLDLRVVMAYLKNYYSD
ncbi:hypothetical protein V6615_11245 [Oscillospiraceae bacterium PP1C4]